ncbi:hypothetical protein GF345_06250 [Candidatus Woesearchaeota archaeon]|nr:hypothetical protein [Candidatus Woesearchaeota archaeon]
MKHRMSISLDEETIALIQARLRKERDIFRNKSHFVECAIKNMFESEKR